MYRILSHDDGRIARWSAKLGLLINRDQCKVVRMLQQLHGEVVFATVGRKGEALLEKVTIRIALSAMASL